MSDMKTPEQAAREIALTVFGKPYAIRCEAIAAAIRADRLAVREVLIQNVRSWEREVFENMTLPGECTAADYDQTKHAARIVESRLRAVDVEGV